MTTILPGAVQNAADYADALEQHLANSGQAEPKADETAGNSPKDETQVHEAQPVEQDGEVVRLRAKYNTLQGKYNSEVPALHQKVKELEQTLQQLSETNSSLRKEIAERESKQSYITEQDREAYGEDMVDLVRRGAREEGAKYAKQAAELKSRLDMVERELKSERENSAQVRASSFFAGLSNLVPGWEEQNSDPGFLEWLEGTDTAYGPRRNDMLQEAFQIGDVRRVAAVFLAYRNQGDKKQNDLARQVSPTHSRGATPPSTDSSQRTISQAEIEAFYEAYRRGQISDEEAERIEKQINDAVAAGRVTL